MMTSKDLAPKMRSSLNEGRNSNIKNLTEEFHPIEFVETTNYFTEKIVDFLKILDDDKIAEILLFIHPSLHRPCIYPSRCYHKRSLKKIRYSVEEIGFIHYIYIVDK